MRQITPAKKASNKDMRQKKKVYKPDVKNVSILDNQSFPGKGRQNRWNILRVHTLQPGQASLYRCENAQEHVQGIRTYIRKEFEGKQSKLLYVVVADMEGVKVYCTSADPAPTRSTKK